MLNCAWTNLSGIAYLIFHETAQLVCMQSANLGMAGVLKLIWRFLSLSLALVIDSELNLFALSISNLTPEYKLSTSTLL